MIPGLMLLALQAAAPAAPSPLAWFEGQWACEGHFIPSNRPLASDMTFHRSATGVLVKSHQDLAPGRYKAEETWGPSPAGVFRASIASDPAGIRWFTSEGWDGDRWTWTRHTAGDEPAERFVYVRVSDERMDMEWWTTRPAGLEMGDILHCSKA